MGTCLADLKCPDLKILNDNSSNAEEHANHVLSPAAANIKAVNHSLARLIQQPSGWVLTAEKDVLLQSLLMKHPVRHAETGTPCINTLLLDIHKSALAQV